MGEEVRYVLYAGRRDSLRSGKLTAINSRKTWTHAKQLFMAHCQAGQDCFLVDRKLAMVVGEFWCEKEEAIK